MRLFVLFLTPVTDSKIKPQPAGTGLTDLVSYIPPDIKTDHFRYVLLSQSLSTLLKKPNETMKADMHSNIAKDITTHNKHIN